MLDLLLTNHPVHVPRVETIPGLSDYDIVYLEFQAKYPHRKQTQQKIPLQQVRLGWFEVCNLWVWAFVKDRRLSKSDDTKGIWKELKEGLLEIVSKFVPHKAPCSKPDTHG